MNSLYLFGGQVLILSLDNWNGEITWNLLLVLMRKMGTLEIFCFFHSLVGSYVNIIVVLFRQRSSTALVGKMMNWRWNVSSTSTSIWMWWRRRQKNASTSTWSSSTPMLGPSYTTPSSAMEVGHVCVCVCVCVCVIERERERERELICFIMFGMKWIFPQINIT